MGAREAAAAGAGGTRRVARRQERGVGVRETGWTVSAARCWTAGGAGVSSLGSAAASAIFRPRPRSGAASTGKRPSPGAASQWRGVGVAVRVCWDALGSMGPGPCPRVELSSGPSSAAPGPWGGVCWRAEVAAKAGAGSRHVVSFAA